MSDCRRAGNCDRWTRRQSLSSSTALVRASIGLAGHSALRRYVLGSDANNRAEQIQMLFSLPYQEDWQQEVETQ